MRDAFVGASYAARRILILDESSYGVGDMGDDAYVRHWLDHPNFVVQSPCKICALVGGPKYKRDRLNDALTTMMLGHAGPTDAERRAAWSKIAFTNFVGRELADRSDGQRPTQKEWKDAAQHLPKTLELLQPRVVLLLNNPSGTFNQYAAPVIDRYSARLVTMKHLTMNPAPTREARTAAWTAVLSE